MPGVRSSWSFAKAQTVVKVMLVLGVVACGLAACGGKSVRTLQDERDGSTAGSSVGLGGGTSSGGNFGSGGTGGSGGAAGRGGSDAGVGGFDGGRGGRGSAGDVGRGGSGGVGGDAGRGGSAGLGGSGGDDTCAECKLLASDGSPSDEFGSSIAVSGDTVVVGAYSDDDYGYSSGSAYVFVRSGPTWVEQQKLLPADGAENNNFGYGVAVSGDTAVVGAHGDDDNGGASGSAYVFERTGSTWVERQKLLPSDGVADDHFGRSVAVSGRTLVVGLTSNVGSRSGSVYVFERTNATWVQQQKLVPSDGAYNDRFGWSVATGGSTVVVGAHGDDDRGEGSGSAYVFERTGSAWVEQQKLLANDGAAGDDFGAWVAVSGDTVVVGMPSDDDKGTNSGSVYVFERRGSTWVERQKLLASDGEAEDYFGRPVAVSGDKVLVGAHQDDDAGDQSGSAYVFGRVGSTWSEQRKLVASDGDAADWFGISVALSGQTAVVGSVWDRTRNGATGSAYVFDLAP